MKTLSVTLLLSLSIACEAFSEVKEKVRTDFDDQTILELHAVKIDASARQAAYGACIYDGQLWDYAMSNPPERILVDGCITLEGQKVSLDVSGLATPAIKPQELTVDDCRLSKHEFGDKDYCYYLEVAFIKGGALDYMVTWMIYRNKSLRIKIEDLDDVRPPWLARVLKRVPDEQ